MSSTLAIRATALAATLVAAPLALRPTRGLVVNDCGAQGQIEDTGTCCPQSGSICNAGGADEKNMFYIPSGMCP